MQSHRGTSRVANPSRHRARSFAWPAAGLVAAFALATPVQAKAQSLDLIGVNGKVKARVDQFKSVNSGALVTSGFAFAVVYPSNSGLITSTLWYGHAPTATGIEAVGPHTLFEVGSVTKTVTATLLAKARADNISGNLDYVLDYLGAPDPAGACNQGILLEDLTDYWSGLPHTAPTWVQTKEDLYASVFNKKDATTGNLVPLQPGDCSPSYIDNTYYYKPRTYYVYSNYGPQVVGNAIAEMYYAETWDDAVQSEIFTPVGIAESGTFDQVASTHQSELYCGSICSRPNSHTDYTCAPDDCAPHDPSGTGGEITVDPQQSFEHPSGSLWMSPSDMVHWLEYNTGALTDLAVSHPDLAYAVHLLQTQIVASQGTAPEQGGGSGQGLAWEFGKLSTADRAGQRSYRYKEGFSPDYEQPTMVCIDDATGVGVAVMANFTRANGDRPTDDMCKDVLESLSATN